MHHHGLFRSLFCAYGSQIRRHNVSTGELVSLYDGHNDEVTDLGIIDKNHLQVLNIFIYVF